MSWQIALFFNIIFGTIRGYLDKRLVDRIDLVGFFFISSIWGTIIMLVLYILRHASLPVIYPEMIVLGGVYAIAIGAYLVAIKISLSQTAAFYPYSMVIPMILAALFLGEARLFDLGTFSGQKTILGLVLAFVALYLILKSGSKKEQKMEKKWSYAIIINSILIGGGTYYTKTFLASHGPLESLISQQLSILPILAAVAIYRKTNLSFSLNSQSLMFLDALVSTLGVIFYYIVIGGGPINLVLPAQTVILTITGILVGLFLFDEVHLFTKEKRLGLAIGVLGVIILLIG